MRSKLIGSVLIIAVAGPAAASVTAIAVGETWGWLARLTTTGIAAMGVMLACREPQGSSCVTWAAIGAGLGAALLMPLATVSTVSPTAVDMCVAAVAWSMAVAGNCNSRRRMMIAAVLGGLGCVVDATAALWMGCLTYASIRRGPGRLTTVVIATAGLMGLSFGWLCGLDDWMPLTRTLRAQLVASDLRVLAPMLVLGWAGLSAGCRAAEWRTAALVVGSVGLALGLVAFPLDVRVCALCLWPGVPSGLRQLSRLLRYHQPADGPLVATGLGVAGLLCYLLARSLHQWADGMLVLYWVAG